MDDGIKSNRIRALDGQNKETIQGTASNGLKFEGIRNVETGEIDNFWPVLEWSE